MPAVEPEEAIEGRVVGILCADGVEQAEVTVPRDALRQAGATVRVIGPGGGQLRGYHYIEPGDAIEADLELSQAEPGMFDCLVVPGGLGGPDTLRQDPDAVDLVRRFAGLGRPLAVICHGPWVLIEAGILPGRSLTCASQITTDVANAGARYVDADTHLDESTSPPLVSGRNHETVEAFAKALLHQLGRA